MKPTPERIASLSLGLEEARNLMEMLAVDFSLLIKTVFPDIAVPAIPAKLGITKRMQLAAALICEQLDFAAVHQKLHNHPSDTMRGILCYVISRQDRNLSALLELINPFADDPHSGVREWAQIALRQKVSQNLTESLDILLPWVHAPSERLRRFASEITRPRGVWCAHIPELKETPWLAMRLLDPLKADLARYVQLSVGNWLNDAGKTHPNWVQEVCSSWLKLSKEASTQKICKRALRNCL
jgi:3-methyladenine DNA glycosylase AlkC